MYKIIQIVDGFGFGGVESFVHDLCIAEAKQGSEVVLVSVVNPTPKFVSTIEKLQEAGVRVTSLGAKSRKTAIFKLLHLRKILVNESRSCKVICNSHLKLSTLMAVLSSIGLNHINCVETYHSQYHDYEFQYKLMHPFVNHYIPVSESAAEEMKKRFKTKENEMTVIPNGVDKEMLQKYLQKRKKHNKYVFVSVGRFTRQKNLIPVIKAFDSIEDSQIEYRIIGDGELKKEYYDAANGNRNIKFLGQLPRNEVLYELVNADCLLMPSLWEGLSIVQLEAMALGLPMILSDIPSFRKVMAETALDNVTYKKCKWGYMVETSNIEAYRKALINMATGNDNERMREEIEIISNKFDINMVAQRYLTVYRKILGLGCQG